jgi:prepilin-type N-terminal cleavage/methylation domain-containing protein
MAQKYTILKVIIQNFSKTNKTSKGFTLIELIVGLSIMLIVGGLAMNALIQASTSFNKDKKSIDSSQNMSTILEMIGNDIKQSGENINDANFPAVEFKIADAAETTLKAGSSKVIIRRALISPLTLCENIGVNQSFTAGTNLLVANNSKTTVDLSANCDVGTSSSPLSVYRIPTTVTDPAPPTTTPATVTTISSYYPPSSVTNPYPITPAPLALKLPLALRKVRDYRCNTNPNTVYDSAANAGADFCSLVPEAKLRIAISNGRGQILTFNQTGEVVATTTADTVVNDNATNDTTSAKKYQITIGKSSPAIPVAPTDAITKNNYNITVPVPTTPPAPASTIAYPIGSPIYVIEERVYTLTSDNKLQLSIDGKAAETLVKKIDNFRVSAKTYTDSKNRIIQPTPAANLCVDDTALPFAAQPATASETDPKYICQFNYFGTTTGTADWKTLAGIKIEIQTKYDGTGQNATATAADTSKLYAVSEFFPRNVLSK